MMYKKYSRLFYGAIFWGFAIALFYEKYALSAFFAALFIGNQLNDVYERLSDILEILKAEKEDN